MSMNELPVLINCSKASFSHLFAKNNHLGVVFFTQKAPSGFESQLYKEKSPIPFWVSDFTWRAARDASASHLNCSKASFSHLFAKNNHLGVVFFTQKAPSGFESLL